VRGKTPPEVVVATVRFEAHALPTAKFTETSESLALEENRGVALGQQSAEAETRDFVALKASR
jgi:hypothetical protein